MEAITDGDTITLLDRLNTQHNIRVAGIDAPERRQPWGTCSRQGLAALLAGKDLSPSRTRRHTAVAEPSPWYGYAARLHLTPKDARCRPISGDPRSGLARKRYEQE